MKTADILIVGTGSLATAVVNSLSQASIGRLRIAIVGRSTLKMAQLAHIANARSITFGTAVTFVPFEIPQFSAQAFSRAIRALKPKVILHVASLQSPWEAVERPSGWTKMVAAAGFGITLPLQLALAAELSRGAADSEAALVNASYPDGVNPVLHRLGLRTTCGIGNSAIVEAFCRSHEKVKSEDVRVIAHHGHLGPWLKGKRLRARPRVWVDDQEIDSFAFRPNLGPIHDELNQVTAATAVSIMMSLLTGRSLRRSVPGVGGLPGGYPFHIRNGKFVLELPSTIPLEEAIAQNRAGEHLDGVDLKSGVRFVGKAGQSLASAGFEYSQGYDLKDWRIVCERMISLRDRLRRVQEQDRWPA
ncbi:MAG: hypothetical protein LAO21_18795 [Acidobacteriia bacterium]|nr:hypothetical protein [Terriglobia bacterium]